MSNWLNQLDQQLSERCRLLENNNEINSSLQQIQRGLEKESLRIAPDGGIAKTDHPAALGSALTHPYITTDYSEALLEFITPPCKHPNSTLKFLHDIHTYTYQNIGQEKLWVNSMPCIIGDENSIPIANYGSSNSGKMKHVYRVGLGHRYGKVMQTIAGIHYNFSLPESFWPLFYQATQQQSPISDFSNEQYFHLIRNFQRYSWLVIYLFGASPALCSSFLTSRGGKLPGNFPIEQINKHTCLLPNGTSLRMSNLGYKNSAQAGINVSYNKLPSYIQSLEHAINTSNPQYEQIGMKDAHGYRQLSTNHLQIENEYYGTIRPKRPTKPGQRPTQALRSSGVEYIEIRLLDLNPFLPLGIDKDTIDFLDVFLLFCLLAPSPMIDAKEQANIDQNIETIVLSGREKHATLSIGETTLTVQQWLVSLLPLLQEVGKLLDHSKNDTDYTSVVARLREHANSPQTTPSGKIALALQENNTSFFEFAMEQANKTADYYRNQTLDSATAESLKAHAEESIDKQKQLEQNDHCDYETYVAKYFS